MNQPEPGGAPRAADEWRAHWLLVLAAMAGISFGTVPSATLGLFMAPLEAEFGWSRAQISSGLTIFAVVSLPLVPFAGVLVDRFGARAVAIPGIGLSALFFAGFGLMGAMLFQYFAIWVAYTLASLLSRTLVFNSAVSRAFVTGRGFAIAVLLSGTAVTQSLAPVLSRWLIDDYGWRTAFFGLGLGWGGFVLVMLLLFFHEPGRRRSVRAASSPPPPAVGGLTVRQALRNLAMQRISVAMFLQSTMTVAVLVHIVPMLTETGLSRAEAAAIAAILGLGSVSGKLATGFLVDRFAGSAVPALTFAGPGIGYAMLLTGGELAWLLPVGVFVMGYCSGGCIQLAAYLTTRYAGLANFGAIFGLVSSLLALSAGVGPLLAGFVYDETGSYRILLTAGIPAALLAGLAVFRLGPYPDFPAAVEPGR